MQNQNTKARFALSTSGILKFISILMIAVFLAVLAPGAFAQDFFGPHVYFRTEYNRYLQAWGGGGGAVYGNSQNPWDWEEFEIWDVYGTGLKDGAIIAIRTKLTRQFISDNGGGVPASADRSWAYGWELYSIKRQGRPGDSNSGDKVDLKSGDKVALISVLHGQSLGLNRNWDKERVGGWFNGTGAWETLTWIDKDCTDANRNNCVFYASSRVPRLPHGLWNINDKKAIINIHDIHAARPGDVAVVDIYHPYGHVAVVEEVYSDGTIRIRQGNKPLGQITEERGQPQDLHIVGYFRP